MLGLKIRKNLRAQVFQIFFITPKLEDTLFAIQQMKEKHHIFTVLELDLGGVLCFERQLNNVFSLITTEFKFPF